MKSELLEIEQLLRERLALIADHAFRDRYPSSHLDRLRAVSTALDRQFQDHRAKLPARLIHFMQQASYQKALAFIEDQGPSRREPNDG